MNSRVIRAADFRSTWYAGRELEFGAYSRKLWEYAVIAQATLDHFDGLRGRQALGFGVGREALPSWFAARGVYVTATDRADETSAWTETGQHCQEKEDLYHPLVVTRDLFDNHVHFDKVDMNHIPPELRREGFDIVWSCGSLEHLGSLRHGMNFVVNAMECVKPGGIAVHTTEYNPDRATPTLESKDLSLYQADHLAELHEILSDFGYELSSIDLTLGTERADRFVDRHPYGPYHLKIDVAGWTTTSVVLVIAKPF